MSELVIPPVSKSWWRVRWMLCFGTMAIERDEGVSVSDAHLHLHFKTAPDTNERR